MEKKLRQGLCFYSSPHRSMTELSISGPYFLTNCPFTWVLSSPSSAKHFERPVQRLLLFPGRGHTAFAPPRLCSLTHTSSTPHSVFCSISERWRFSILKVSSWTRITWGDKQEAQKKRTQCNTCSENPTGIFHPQFKYEYKARLGLLILHGTYTEDHINNHAQSFTSVFKDATIQASSAWEISKNSVGLPVTGWKTSSKTDSVNTIN